MTFKQKLIKHCLIAWELGGILTLIVCFAFMYEDISDIFVDVPAGSAMNAGIVLMFEATFGFLYMFTVTVNRLVSDALDGVVGLVRPKPKAL